MSSKKGRKGKKGARKGKKGGRKSSVAKRGAAKRTTLKAGFIVTKKPRKSTLKSHKMHVKVVGKMASSGKTAFKLVRNKRRAK